MDASASFSPSIDTSSVHSTCRGIVGFHISPHPSECNNFFFFCCRSSISSPSRSDDAYDSNEKFWTFFYGRSVSRLFKLQHSLGICNKIPSRFDLFYAELLLDRGHHISPNTHFQYVLLRRSVFYAGLLAATNSIQSKNDSFFSTPLRFFMNAICNQQRHKSIPNKKREKEQWMNGEAEVDSQRNHWNLIAFDIVECTCWCVFHPLHFTRSSSTRFVLENVCRCRPCSHMWPSSTAPTRGWGGRMMVTFDLNLDLARFGWTIITCVKSHSQREEGFLGMNKSRIALGWLTFFRD